MAAAQPTLVERSNPREIASISQEVPFPGPSLKSCGSSQHSKACGFHATRRGVNNARSRFARCVIQAAKRSDFSSLTV